MDQKEFDLQLYAILNRTIDRAKERLAPKGGTFLCHLTFAMPRFGNKVASRVSFSFISDAKKAKPIPLWSGIVNEHTIVRPHDTVAGFFGLMKVNFDRIMRGERK